MVCHLISERGASQGLPGRFMCSGQDQGRAFLDQQRLRSLVSSSPCLRKASAWPPCPGTHIPKEFRLCSFSAAEIERKDTGARKEMFETLTSCVHKQLNE